MGCFCGAAVVATDPATLGAGESIFQGIILFLNFLQKFRFIGHYSVENSSNLPTECLIILNWKAHISRFYLKKCLFLLKMCTFYTIDKQTKRATHLWKSHQCAPRCTLLNTLSNTDSVRPRVFSCSYIVDSLLFLTWTTCARTLNGIRQHGALKFKLIWRKKCFFRRKRKWTFFHKYFFM